MPPRDFVAPTEPAVIKEAVIPEAELQMTPYEAEDGEDLVDRVIGKVPKDEQKILDEAAAEAAKAAKDIIEDGVDNAMNRHNHR